MDHIDHGSRIMDPSTRLKILTNKANDFLFDIKIPVIRYSRSLKELEKMAITYAQESQVENAFILYMKLIVLSVEKLPKHPQFSTLDTEQRSIMKKRSVSALKEAEELKKRIMQLYEKEYQQWIADEKAKEEKMASDFHCHQKTYLPLQVNNILHPTIFESRDSFVSQSSSSISSENQKPSVTQSQDVVNQIKLPSYSTISLDQPSVSVYSTVSLDQPSVSVNSTISLDQPSVSVYSTILHVQPTAPPYKDFANDKTPSFSDFQPTPPSYKDIFDDKISFSNEFKSTAVQPTAPSYNDIFDNKILFSDDFKNNQHKQPDANSQPNVNRSTKPLNMINDFKNNYEEIHSSLHGKRFIILPADLTIKFLLLAGSNTKRNIETCGILCGRLIQSQFRVTHLIIPKQHGTSDSCTTEKEEEMFDVQDKHDLITVGWIHTHPSQTCFLSSVDLHTQCSYQQLLPEAIAVVCSPKFNTIGVYRLTTHGLKLIANCTQNGFHPHTKDPPLFEESSGINIDDCYGITIVDLRN